MTRVHVIEDDEFLRRSLERLLMSAVYEVLAWSDADEAVAAVRDLDLVVADGLRTRAGADVLDALLDLGRLIAAVRFGFDPGEPHPLEVARLQKPVDTVEILCAVAEAAGVMGRVVQSCVGAGVTIQTGGTR